MKQLLMCTACAACAVGQPTRPPPLAVPHEIASRPPPATTASEPLTPQRAVRFRRISDLHFSPGGAALACVVSEATDAGTESHIWMTDLARGELHPFTSSSKSELAPAWSPDGRHLAFVSSRDGDPQVYVMPIEGGEASRITTAQGGATAFRWSPDSARIAYLAHRAGRSGAVDDPVVADREQDLEQVWLVDVATRQARPLTDRAMRIDELVWPTAQQLVALATEQPRSESWNRAIYSIDATDGSFALIARPPPPIAALVPSPSGRALAFAGTAAHGPMPHDLFVLDATGAQDRSAALDRAVLEARWQDDATVVVRAATGFRTALYRLRAGQPPSPIELPYSVRTFDVARDGTVAFVGVDFDRLPELYVKSPNGAVRRFSRIQDAGWDRVGLAAPELFRFASFDGATVEAALFTPPRTGPRRRDPLVLLVHGGPNSSFSADYFWFNAWVPLLVARGYQVLLVNPRGSTGYGEAFVKANRGDLGGGDYRDLMTAVDHVLARGQTDPARLGIGGWSYGGEMAAWAIGHTARFKAAVVGAGVFDQAAEFGTEDGVAGDEWQFGTPWDNPEVFARNSPSTFIGHARTPTLIVHGGADRNNPIGQSQALYRGEPHLPRRTRNQRDVLERMLRWFDGHLGPPAAADPAR